MRAMLWQARRMAHKARSGLGGSGHLVHQLLLGLLQLGLNCDDLLLHELHGALHELWGLGDEGFAGRRLVKGDDAVEFFLRVGVRVDLEEDGLERVHGEGLLQNVVHLGGELVGVDLLFGGKLLLGGLFLGGLLHGGGHLGHHLAHHGIDLGQDEELLDFGALACFVGVGGGKGEKKGGDEGEQGAGRQAHAWVLWKCSAVRIARQPGLWATFAGQLVGCCLVNVGGGRQAAGERANAS